MPPVRFFAIFRDLRGPDRRTLREGRGHPPGRAPRTALLSGPRRNCRQCERAPVGSDRHGAQALSHVLQRMPAVRLPRHLFAYAMSLGPDRPALVTGSAGPAARPRRDRGGEYISLAASRQASRSVPAGRQQGGPTMPHYEFYCERCRMEVTLTLSIGERERRDYKCPGCGGKKLEPLMGTFFSQTSRKA